MRLGDHCGRYLAELARARGDVWVLDADLADSDGAVHFATEHPDRFVEGGIAEQSLVSMAAGMAACGARPWVFSFAAFLCFRAYDQIRVGLSQARQPVTLVGSHAGGCAGRNGKTHSALNDLALMTTLPGMRVWSPGDPADVRAAVDDVLAEAAPAYIRLPRRALPALPGAPAAVRWVTAPAPAALITTGLSTHLAVDACTLLEELGHRVGVVHCARLVPFPADELVDLVDRCGVLVTVEDHVPTGGLGSLVRDRAGLRPVASLGWPAEWSSGSGNDADVLSSGALDPFSICVRVAAALDGIGDAGAPPAGLRVGGGS